MVLVSLVVLVALLSTATTPEQARAQRAIPDLPPPAMVVEAGSRAGVVAVPAGAIVTDEDARTWVTVWTERDQLRVEVHALPSTVRRLVEVTGAGLEVGDLVELVAAEDAEARPRAVAPADEADR